MKALKLRLDDELYERFKRLHPNYGEESRVFRELIEQYVKQQEGRGVRKHRCPKSDYWGVCGCEDENEPHKV